MSFLGSLGAMRKEYRIDPIFRSAPARCVPLPDIPDRSLLLPTTRTNHDLIIVYKPTCDTKLPLWSVSLTIQASVQACLHPVRASLVMAGCEAIGKAQGTPNHTGETGQGEDWTGERE